MARIINGQRREDGRNEERVINLGGGTYNEVVHGDCINIEGRSDRTPSRKDLSQDGEPPIDVKAK